MMTPCRKLYYAVEAVVYIAYHSDSQPISSRDIARVQGLPSRHLEQIMQRLVHGGILRGMRGPKGGYLLANRPEDISVQAICALVTEEDTINGTPHTTILGTEIVRPFWQVLHREIEDRLSQISIADLCLQGIEKKLPRSLVAKFASAV